MKNIEIVELLPNKEDYSLNNAGAASIWVKNFNTAEIAKKQSIYGNSSKNNFLSKNFVNLKKKKLN